jgi:hypothetical protein
VNSNLVFAIVTLAGVAATSAPRPFAATVRSSPDTSAAIGVFADQLPGGLSAEQTRFAATHYVGTQKLTLDLSRPLRAINPNFLVVHYHLAMWQAAPRVRVLTVPGLWHWVFRFPIAFALTVVLAAISHRWLECPFLRFKDRFGRDAPLQRTIG